MIDRAGRGEFEIDRFGEGEYTPFGFLLHCAHTGQLQHPRTGRAVEDGYFATIKLNKGVVDLTAMECRHKVLDSGNGVSASADGGTTRGFAHLGGESRKGDDVETVGSTESDAEVGRSRTDCDRDRAPSVQAQAGEAKILAYSGLFHSTGVK